MPSKNYCMKEWIDLYTGHVTDCAQLAAWLAVEMAGQHIQLRMEHPNNSYEWTLSFHVIPSGNEKDDPNREAIIELVENYLEEISDE